MTSQSTVRLGLGSYRSRWAFEKTKRTPPFRGDSTSKKRGSVHQMPSLDTTVASQPSYSIEALDGGGSAALPPEGKDVFVVMNDGLVHDGVEARAGAWAAPALPLQRDEHSPTDNMRVAK